eukprot:6164355-Pleurochrysis_carterae.AAC.1
MKEHYWRYTYDPDMVDPDDPLNKIHVIFKTNLTDKAIPTCTRSSSHTSLPRLRAPRCRPTPRASSSCSRTLHLHKIRKLKCGRARMARIAGTAQRRSKRYDQSRGQQMKQSQFICSIHPSMARAIATLGLELKLESRDLSAESCYIIFGPLRLQHPDSLSQRTLTSESGVAGSISGALAAVGVAAPQLTPDIAAGVDVVVAGAGAWQGGVILLASLMRRSRSSTLCRRAIAAFSASARR